MIHKPLAGITFDIRWPPIYKQALDFLGSIVQLDLPSAMPLDCIANFGFFGAAIATSRPGIVMLC